MPQTFLKRQLTEAWCLLNEGLITLPLKHIKLEHHHLRFRECFECIGIAIFKCKWASCDTIGTEAKCLGRSITEEGTWMLSENFKTEKLDPKKKKLKTLKNGPYGEFLRVFTIYYREFNPDNATKVHPMMISRKNYVTFRWSRNIQCAFEKFEEDLSNIIALALPAKWETFRFEDCCKQRRTARHLASGASVE